MLENYAELLLFISYTAAYRIVEGHKTPWGTRIPGNTSLRTPAMQGTTQEDRFQHMRAAMNNESPRAYEMAQACVRNWLYTGV